MIREERNPEFWTAIAAHPEVAPHVTLSVPGFDLAAVIAEESVLPLASDHGGFLFVRLDGLGRVLELHTMFTPEGWGREALTAGKGALQRIFETAALITTFEVEGYWRSAPPKSFGWRPAGGFMPALGATLRTWFLTPEAWRQSPAMKRMTH